MVSYQTQRRFQWFCWCHSSLLRQPKLHGRSIHSSVSPSRRWCWRSRMLRGHSLLSPQLCTRSLHCFQPRRSCHCLSHSPLVRLSLRVDKELKENGNFTCAALWILSFNFCRCKRLKRILPVLMLMGGLKRLWQFPSWTATLKAYLCPHARLDRESEMLGVVYSTGGAGPPMFSTFMT